MLNFNSIKFFEILPRLKQNSEVIILDFNQIPPDLPDYKNIKVFFSKCKKEEIDPKLPKNRQGFNDALLLKTGKRYLIGRYGEDRKEMLKGSHIEKENRTIHLGIDIFSSTLESIYSPFRGIIVRADKEAGPNSYGYYIIIKHDIKGQIWYSFFGHLSKDLPKLGTFMKDRQKIATLGNFEENGGWSRHIHYQILLDLPPVGKTPIGYSTKEDFKMNSKIFPDPRIVLGKVF